MNHSQRSTQGGVFESFGKSHWVVKDLSSSTKQPADAHAYALLGDPSDLIFAIPPQKFKQSESRSLLSIVHFEALETLKRLSLEHCLRATVRLRVRQDLMNGWWTRCADEFFQRLGHEQDALTRPRIACCSRCQQIKCQKT